MKRRRKAEDRIDHAPHGLAITSPELAALRRHLHRQVLIAIEAFWEDRRNEIAQMEERELKLARWRREIERRHAVWLLNRRQQQIPQIDWTNPPEFEKQTVRKRHDRSLAEIERRFRPEAFLVRLTPCLCEFASLVAIFERGVLPGIPPPERHAHSERMTARIVELIFGRPPRETPMPPEVRYVRTSDEKVWAGKVIAGPFEILLDAGRRRIGYRPVERRGEFERLPLGNLWGLLRIMKRPRRLLRQTIQARLRSDFVEMAADRRSRKQMAEDCRTRHGVSHKEIPIAARVSSDDYYRWRDNNPRVGPKKHRRILFAVCSPIWPPPSLI
jgi:hypothetical protein